MAFTYELKADEITLKWEEPNNNGAEITMYTVYYGTQSDEQWKETEKITDVSVRKYVVKVEMGQKYKVLVTASNKYGESSKEGKMQRVDIPEGGLSSSLTKRVYSREIHSRSLYTEDSSVMFTIHLFSLWVLFSHFRPRDVSPDTCNSFF